MDMDQQTCNQETMGSEMKHSSTFIEDFTNFKNDGGAPSESITSDHGSSQVTDGRETEFAKPYDVKALMSALDDWPGPPDLASSSLEHGVVHEPNMSGFKAELLPKAQNTRPARPTTGTVPTGVKKLYATNKSDCSCCMRWSEYENAAVEENILKAQSANFAIVHKYRQEKDKTHGTQGWITDSIVIQSPDMRKILLDVLKGYPDLDLDVKELTFWPPFKPIVHRWHRLTEFLNDAKDAAIRQHAYDLIHAFEATIVPSLNAIQHMKHTGHTTFDSLWQIMAPGTIVISRKDTDTAYKIRSFTFVDEGIPELTYWLVSLRYIDWNGSCAGLATSEIRLLQYKYKGMVDISSLPVYPIEFCKDLEKVQADLLRRGRAFEALRGYHFKDAGGPMLVGEVLKPLFGRVIVDAHAYYTCNAIVKPTLRGSNEAEDTRKNQDTDPYGEGNMDLDEEDSINKTVKETETSVRVEDLTPLTDEQCILANPRVKAFHLKSKTWGDVLLDDLHDIQWKPEMYDNLVLQNNEKGLALAFVEHKRDGASAFDDFVPDKGRGLTILMFGPPGVGKTFTAEAVAEKSKVPLYIMSAADLGTEPRGVEKALDLALECCKLWNAILLLDEADVFLATRNEDNLLRNELVSNACVKVFLRRLEYYEGILFLTSNRIKSIDPAFSSRVDLILPYRELTGVARRKVWENFIKKVGEERFELDDGGLDELAEIKVNGREIKSLVKSAQLMSGRKKVTLTSLKELAKMREEAQRFLEG